MILVLIKLALGKKIYHKQLQDGEYYYFSLYHNPEVYKADLLLFLGVVSIPCNIGYRDYKRFIPFVSGKAPDYIGSASDPLVHVNVHNGTAVHTHECMYLVYRGSTCLATKPRPITVFDQPSATHFQTLSSQCSSTTNLHVQIASEKCVGSGLAEVLVFD